MSQFGDLYAQYYDLLYADKDYQAEVNYVDTLIIRYTKDAKTLLDLGCGTGRHDELFCKKGYSVHGVDLSEEMLKIARTKENEKLTFTHSNIHDLALDREFDVVISLFHVISYQNSNSELIKTFEVAKKHLKSGGVFIFDFWYGPAVFTDLPTTRIKRLENDDIKITRIAEPIMHSQNSVVDVNYDIFIEDKTNHTIIQKKELHKMRYLFDNELEMICDKIGFKVLDKYQWMCEKAPSYKSWNVVWVVKK